MIENIHQLLYSSSAVRPFSDAELKALLDDARTRNARVDVTGLLLYHAGSFIQALEGPQEQVEQVFAKIRRDPRHDSVVQLLSRSLTVRQFPDWRMGFSSDSATLGRLPGFSDFLRVGASASERSQAAKGILDGFRLGRFRSHVRG